MVGFLAYLACAILFYGIAAYALLSKQPVGIWAHGAGAGRPNVSDVKGYNIAVSRMFAAYGTLMVICSLPMLLGMEEAWVLMISVIGIAIGTIGMFICAVRIDEKYRSRRH